MKVIDAIKQLQELNHSDEIIIMYWARDLFNDYFEKDNQISVDVWDEMVERLDNHKHLDGVSSNAHEIIEAELAEMEQEQ